MLDGKKKRQENGARKRQQSGIGDPSIDHISMDLEEARIGPFEVFRKHQPLCLPYRFRELQEHIFGDLDKSPPEAGTETIVEAN